MYGLSASQLPLSQSEQLHHMIAQYARSGLFAQHDSFTVNDNPYRRPVRPQDLLQCDFTQKLSKEQFCSTSALMAQRMLMNIYESDLVFLPQNFNRESWQDFQSFYADDLKISGEIIRPVLEQHLFSFLQEEITVNGKWSMEAMQAYFDKRLEEDNSGESNLCTSLLANRNPSLAAQQLLVQMAGDFLTEASAMARNVLGNFGAPLSELFKVLIDEYGYGVASEKHSALYEVVLESAGLVPHIHHYWQFYLPGSMALVNYFHLISRNHRHLFRYIGAVFYTEATLAAANRHLSSTLRNIFGEKINTRYFDEHAHIDEHHGTMVLEKVILPMVKNHGTHIIPEIIQGFEEFRLLQELADEDLILQNNWATDLSSSLLTDETKKSLLSKKIGEAVVLTEEKGLISNMHCHDQDELFCVEDGELEFVAGVGCSQKMTAGDTIHIPAGRLHGTKILSPKCRYSAQAIG